MPGRARLRCPQDGAEMSRTCRHNSESVQPRARKSPDTMRRDAARQSSRPRHRRRRLHRRPPGRELVREAPPCARSSATTRATSAARSTGSTRASSPTSTSCSATCATSSPSQRAVEGTEIVFHLGAQIAIPYSYVNPRDFFETNVLGTLNVAQAALRARRRGASSTPPRARSTAPRRPSRSPRTTRSSRSRPTRPARSAPTS